MGLAGSARPAGVVGVGLDGAPARRRRWRIPGKLARRCCAPAMTQPHLVDGLRPGLAAAWAG